MKKIILLVFVCSVLIAETVISPNMNLPVPVVGTTPGPDWANNINSCMSSIDSHDHTPGHGVQISSDSLDISSDLSLNNNSLIDTKSVTFNAQPSFSTRQAIYVISPDLIYNDANGNTIRITQNGSVSGSSGTITGLPSGTASASYQSVGGTFQFQSSTNTPANITGASVSIAQQTTSPNTITLKSPNSLGASYNVTFPASVPSFTSLLSMSTSGVLSTVPYRTPTIQTFTSGTGTYTLPTGPSPIYLKIKMAGGGGGGGAAATNSGSDGGATSFGTSLLTASPGIGGDPNTAASGGTGGSYTINSPAIGYGFVGGDGSSGMFNSSASVQPSGGTGGSNPFGGGGGSHPTTGLDGAPNTGAGGGGGNGGASQNSGSGGGAGGYIEAIISSPSSTYSYTVGAGGAGALTGSGAAGGAGAAGIIIVEEHYQ